ncbi:MAG TPA: GNAT family N-acetyltransferase [Steroidobacteraceae bacterium]|nr:GNAT family N-acetyltransferase [Steroidobacteraceae bacterium]
MLSEKRLNLRRLEAPDVHAVLGIIDACRREYGLADRVQAILEPSDRHLYETYGVRRSAYFVAIVDDEIVGGAGISRLPGSDGSICELQRMYLRQRSRGEGIGRALLQQCLQAARRFGYRQCYAETIGEMGTALSLYESHGFRQLEAPLGSTGHGHNNRWLILGLQPSGTRSLGI